MREIKISIHETFRVDRVSRVVLGLVLTHTLDYVSMLLTHELSCIVYHIFLQLTLQAVNELDRILAHNILVDICHEVIVVEYVFEDGCRVRCISLFRPEITIPAK